MCTPVALGVASLVASVGGFAMQGYSQSQAANYNAQVARNNQTIAQQNSKIALQQGQVAEDAQRQKTAQLIGAEEAQQGASGVRLDSGSPLAVRSSAAETGELDALTIRYNAQLASRNALTQASSFGAQAALADAQSNWAIGNSILGSASSVSDKWLRYSIAGVPGFGSNQPKGQLGQGSGDSPYAFMG